VSCIAEGCIAEGAACERERGTLRFQLSDQPVDVVLPRADHPQRHHLDPAILCRVGDGDGVLVNIETHEEHLARLAHG
jgi:hypothetical protein